jgi:H+/gluconate symporter-like permease
MPEFIGTTAVIGVLIPIVAMLIGLIIVIYAFNRSYKIKLLEHQQRMAAIEKGVELPPMQFERPRPHYPFTWPFIFIGFGLALALIYIIDRHADIETLGFGLVILFVGLGLFASRYYGVKKAEMENKTKEAIVSSSGTAQKDLK